MCCFASAVGHAGQAVTLAAARGQHLFTRTKLYLMGWARPRGGRARPAAPSVPHDRVPAVYVDLPLVSPGTALVGDHLEALVVSYSGIFPNRRADGDVMRMQSLHGIRISTEDVVVASGRGRELLNYVLADLPQGSIT